MHELNENEIRLLILNSKAFEIVFECLSDEYKSLVRNCDISNANHMWKLIFDEYVDEMKYAIRQRVANDEGIERASTSCLVGHIEQPKEGNNSSLNVENCGDENCDECVDHLDDSWDNNIDSSDEDNVEMSREELVSYV